MASLFENKLDIEYAYTHAGAHTCTHTAYRSMIIIPIIWRSTPHNAVFNLVNTVSVILPLHRTN